MVYNKFRTRFQEQLDEYKSRHPGTTQKKIAESIGISSQTFSNYLYGREPNFDTLIALANFFNVSIDYLLGNTEWKNPFNLETDALNLSEDENSLLTTFKNIDDNIIDAYFDNRGDLIEILCILLQNKSGITFLSALSFYLGILSNSDRKRFISYRFDSDYDAHPNSKLLLQEKNIYLGAMINELQNLNCDFWRKRLGTDDSFGGLFTKK